MEGMVLMQTFKGDASANLHRYSPYFSFLADITLYQSMFTIFELDFPFIFSIHLILISMCLSTIVRVYCDN